MAYSTTGTSFAATVITMTIMAFVVMTSRVFIRCSVVSSFGPDDWFIIAAMTFTILMSAMMLAQVHYGLGKHVWEVSTLNQMLLSKYLYISVIFYNGAVGLTKISILLQYIRIFATKKMKLACRIVLVLNSLFTLETVIISIFDCTPIPYFWDRTIPGGHCVNFGAMWFSHASTNIVFDLVLVVLPMPVINSLNLPRKQKIALMIIFALGTFASVTSVLRLQSLYSISYSTDVTFDNVGAALWSCVEINTAIICASLPTFKAALNRIFPRLLGSTRNGSTPHPSRTWRFQSGTHNIHQTLASMHDEEKGEGETVRLELARREGGYLGAVRTNCEKGVATTQRSDDASSLGRESEDDRGIKVVTVVRQQHEAAEGHEGPLSPPLENDSRAQSLVRSEEELVLAEFDFQHDRR